MVKVGNEMPKKLEVGDFLCNATLYVDYIVGADCSKRRKISKAEPHSITISKAIQCSFSSTFIVYISPSPSCRHPQLSLLHLSIPSVFIPVSPLSESAVHVHLAHIWSGYFSSCHIMTSNNCVKKQITVHTKASK